MTKRRRYSNGHYQNGSVWNAGTAINVFGIPVITIIFGLGGFYLLTKDTLQRHETALTQSIPEQFNKESAAIAAEAKARQDNRNEYLDKLGKINDSVQQLNTHAAVQDESDKQIASTLDRISRQLESATIRPSVK